MVGQTEEQNVSGRYAGEAPRELPGHAAVAQTSDFDPATVCNIEAAGLDLVYLEAMIKGLAPWQAKVCIDYECAHQARPTVLALLSSCAAIRKEDVAVCIADLTPLHQEQIKYALMLSRAHLRHALEGSALEEAKAEVALALTTLGMI